jgi:hypothetical protein
MSEPTPSPSQLIGHLLGALDDDEHEWVDTVVDYDEDSAEKLVEWRRRIAPLEMMRPEIEPPRGLAERTCRYVASCIPLFAQTKRRMSQCPAPPSCMAGLRWSDVVTVVSLLLMTGAVLFPAIDGSRFQARLASCQDGLRHLGLALSQYGYHQRQPIGQLASNGRLTHAGLGVVGLLQNGPFSEGGRDVCPDAWLAAQGALQEASSGGNNGMISATTVAAINRPFSIGNLGNSWSGTSRNGMIDLRQPSPAPAETPLLADAPSADLPDQGFASATWSHGGRGRNFLFEDCHTDFLPAVTSSDAAETFNGNASTSFTPVVFIVGQR